MFVVKSELVLFLIFFRVSDCERRITDGKVVTSDKSYMVYLIKASIGPKLYDTWLCGGALVTIDFILTSAACVQDVQFMYAIAGYRKYVPDKYVESDDCIQNMRKKIIFTCIPRSYEFDYHQFDKWSQIDIALARVESAYNFNDARYDIMCSYIPSIIPINFEAKHQTANTDAMVLGWGHSKVWRKHGNKENFNQEDLHYAPTLILDKEKCKEEFKIYPNMVEIVEKYMICTLETGNLGENGETILPSPPNATGCAAGQGRVGVRDEACEQEMKEKYYQDSMMDRTRKANNMSLKQTVKEIKNETSMLNKTTEGFLTRRSGICQNDHGGPLVTWVGSHEILIGVASVFRVTEDNDCIGPYLFTSTHCNGAFLDCILNKKFGTYGQNPDSTMNATRREFCDSPPSVRGFDTIEKYISWKDHPHGPAANEGHETSGRNGAERFQDKGEYMFKDRFATNQAFPAKVEHRINDRFASNQRFPPKKEDTVQDRFVSRQGFPARNERPSNYMFRANEQIPAKKSTN